MTVSYPTETGTGEGYLATPASGAGGPGVIVFHAWWGLVPHIRALADRFAEAGFVALAPDLYHGAHAATDAEAAELMRSLDVPRAAADIAGAVDHIARHAGRIGAAGFGMGGTVALWAGTLADRITATAAFYPVPDWARMAPDWSAYAGKSAVVHCAEGDGTSAAPAIQAVSRAIVAAGGECALHDYPGTEHAFFNDDRPDFYAPSAAASSWARTLELFRNRLS